MSAPPPQTKSGQSGTGPLTGLRAPSKSTEGIFFLNSTPQEGSVFVDGKRRSARSNYSYTADGTPAADEYVLDKAKRRAAIRNLDSHIAASLRGSNIASSPGNPSFISSIDIQKDTCIANLNLLEYPWVVLAKRLMSPTMHLKESRWIGLPFSQI